MKSTLLLPLILLFVATSFAQTFKTIRVKVVYDTSDASSSAVVPLLSQKIAGQPKFFTVATGDDKDLVVIADCYRDASTDPYSCFYTVSKWLGATQAFLGGAIVVKKSADDAAAALFASLVQDVAERWNSTDRLMLIGELETCLELTESSCSVPTPLVPELKTKTINLSQYLRAGGLKADVK